MRIGKLRLGYSSELLITLDFLVKLSIRIFLICHQISLNMNNEYQFYFVVYAIKQKWTFLRIPVIRSSNRTSGDNHLVYLGRFVQIRGLPNGAAKNGR